MELKQVLRILRQWWLAAAGAFAIVLAIGFAAALVPTEQYTASTKVLAQPDPQRMQFGQIQVVEFLMPAIETRLHSATLRARVRRALPSPIADAPFSVSFANRPGTGIFDVIIEGPDSTAVAAIANEYTDQLVREQPVGDLLQISLLDRASIPGDPSAPAKKSIIAAAFVLGLIMATLVPLILNSLVKRLGTSDDVRRRFGTGVLGQLPPIREIGPKEQSIMAVMSATEPVTLEAFRRLQTNVQLAIINQRQAILVTSLGSGEGKSTVAASLAWLLASSGEEVVLVDGDLRRPTVHKKLGRPFSPGLAEYNAGDPIPLKVTALPTLQYISAGVPVRHPSEHVTRSLPMLVSQLEDRGAVVIIDAPPLVGIAETKLMAAITGSVILVVDARQYRESAMEEAMYDLQAAGATVLGVVVNRSKLPRSQRRAYDSYLADAKVTRRRGRRRDRDRGPTEPDPKAVEAARSRAATSVQAPSEKPSPISPVTPLRGPSAPSP